MKILLAVDDSTYSTEAVAAVAARLWPPRTTVRVLSAVEQIPPPAAELWYDAGGSLERARQELVKRAEQVTQRTVEALSNAGVIAEAFEREGDARSVIVDEAKDWDSDLIVLGSHGYPGFKRWLLGSVAQAIASHAACSVEIVRRKQAAES